MVLTSVESFCQRVCKSWHRTLSSMPDLWAQLDVPLYKRPQVEHLKHMVKLAGQNITAVRIQHLHFQRSDENQYHMALFLACLPTLQHLELRYSSSGSRQQWVNFPAVSTSSLKARRLQTLVLFDPNPVHVPFWTELVRYSHETLKTLWVHEDTEGSLHSQQISSMVPSIARAMGESLFPTLGVLETLSCTGREMPLSSIVSILSDT